MSPADLRSADAELARREPALPGLAVVLDADALLERLDALLPDGADRPFAARVEYVRYKPATSVIAGVTLRTPRGEVAAYAKAVRADARAKLDKARRNATADAALPVVLDPRLGLTIGPAAADRRLPGARALAGRPRPTVLRYKPERRLVTRGAHDGRPALRKAHRRDAALAAAAAQRALAAGGAPVPELLHVDARRGIVTCAWIDGTPLHDLAGDAAAEARAGAALARLHRSAAELHATPPVADGLAAAVSPVAALVPALGPRAAALARRLADRLDRHDAPHVPIHGDWSADQGLLTPTGVVLVDLDRARRGDPAADVATWIAAAHVAGDADPDAAPDDVAGALLAGHTAAGGPALRDRLAAPVAAALLRRAVEPFRTRQAGWPDAIDRLLTIAERAAPR